MILGIHNSEHVQMKLCICGKEVGMKNVKVKFGSRQIYRRSPGKTFQNNDFYFTGTCCDKCTIELAFFIQVSRCYIRLTADGSRACLSVRCRATGAAETKRFDLVTERFEQWSSVGPQ